MDTPAPLLPVHGEAECKLFEKKLRVQASPDFDQMAIEWCKDVDGIDIFPKLPVYLRTYHKQWERNNRVRDAVKKAKSGIDALAAINAATLTDLLQPTGDGFDSASASTLAPTQAPALTPTDAAPTVAVFTEPTPHPTMQPPSSTVPVLPAAAAAVGGHAIGGSVPTKSLKRGHGKRLGDKKKRASRKCQKCVKQGGG